MKSNNSKKLQILIKTDGDNKIGMGHIYRCMALSHELKNLDSVIQFLIPKNKIIENKLKKFGKCFFSPNNETKELKLIKKLKPDIIIIDILPKYFQYRNRYLKKIKNHPYRSFTLQNKFLKPFNKDFLKFHQRQLFPKSYYPTGMIYTFWAKNLEKFGHMYGPKIFPLLLTDNSRWIDIDSLHDFFVAEMTLKYWNQYSTSYKNKFNKTKI